MPYELTCDTNPVPVTSATIVAITRALGAELRGNLGRPVRWRVAGPGGLIWAGLEAAAQFDDAYRTCDELYRSLAYVAALQADGLLPLDLTGRFNARLADSPTG